MTPQLRRIADRLARLETSHTPPAGLIVLSFADEAQALPTDAPDDAAAIISGGAPRYRVCFKFE